MFGNIELAVGYVSKPQQVRRISEEWIARNGYCLNCPSDRLIPTTRNTKACDFVCSNCKYDYELKSKQGTFSTSVLDGAYQSMLGVIRAGKTPNFLLLEYTESWQINSLKAIHRTLITENAILARKPLSASARRAGWIGCNILLSSVARDGQICLVTNGIMEQKQKTRQAFARLEPLAHLPVELRGWAALTLNIISRLPSKVFSLPEIYQFEVDFQRVYPRNRNVRPKIRQQLQVLREAGLLSFKGAGIYEITS